MRCPKRPVKSVRSADIGDFTTRDAYDGKCSARVVRKIGPRFDDVESHTLCRTDDGAMRLAALMNAARDLARDWRQISETGAFKDQDPQAWVRWVIVKAVATAIDGPPPDLPTGASA
jgi:hypothetical protein